VRRWRPAGSECAGRRGVGHFDAWAASFAEAVTALEPAPDGSGYRIHTRFAKFINLPELPAMFRTVADAQTAETLKLPRPEIATGRPQIVTAPASELSRPTSRGLRSAAPIRSVLQDFIAKSQEMPGIEENAHEHHAKILAAIRQRNPDKARREMRSHLADLREGVHAALAYPTHLIALV
jgi:N12 class adenine-specific DNA methylase